MTNSEQQKQDTYWKRIVAILTAGWIVIWIYRCALTPVYSILSEYFGGASDAVWQYLELLLSRLCHHADPFRLACRSVWTKRVIVPGFTLFAIGSAIVSASTTLPVLYAGSALAGVGCGTFYGCAYSLTAENVPVDRKSLSTAIVNSGMAIGSGLGAHQRIRARRVRRIPLADHDHHRARPRLGMVFVSQSHRSLA